MPEGQNPVGRPEVYPDLPGLGTPQPSMATYVPRKAPDVATDGRTGHAALSPNRGVDHRGDHGVGPQCESLSMPVQAMAVYSYRNRHHDARHAQAAGPVDAVDRLARHDRDDGPRSPHRDGGGDGQDLLPYPSFRRRNAALDLARRRRASKSPRRAA